MTNSTRTPDRERLLDAVAQIGPELGTCAAEAEELRRLPDRAVGLMQQADLFRCAAPREVGGLEVHPVVQTEIFEAVTAAESNAGWNLMIGAIWDNWLGAKLPDDGARAVFNGDGWPITAGLIWPFGTARVDGSNGYRLSGRWKFASGINQASWVGSGCTIMDGEAPRIGPTGTPMTMIAVLPKGKATVHDTWHTAGLRGTGSCDYSIEDEPVDGAFVFNGIAPTGIRGGPWWRLPGIFHAGPGHTGFALGVAKRCLDEVSAIGAKRRYTSPSAQAERETVQMELGRRKAEYEAVRLFAFDSFARTYDNAEQGQPPLGKPVSVYATEVAVRCAEFAYKTMGGDALFEQSPVQRYLRDILAAQQHVGASDVAFARYGKEALDASNQ